MKIFDRLRSIFKSGTLPAAPAIVRRDGGVFSTDAPLRRRSRRDAPHTVGELFQRTAADFRSPTGAAMDADPYGSDIKSVWAASSEVPNALWGWFAGQGFIGYQLCAILAQNWLVDKACSVPARDATRVAYTVSADGDQQLTPAMVKDIDRMDKRFGLRTHGKELVRNGKIFGIRIALFDVQSPDPQYYEKPFNPDGVTPGSYRGISQIDPYWCSPELDAVAAADPASRHFYEPTYWRINGRRYHRSHLIIMRTCDVPDVLKPTYYYGGIPLPQQIMERVYAAERTANEAPQLAQSKRTTVMTGLNEAAIAGDEDAFAERMSEWTKWRDNYGVKVCGGDEQLQQFDTSLADFDATIMTQYMLVAAIAKMPSTKLLGTSPKGFNATGEYDESDYHEELESILEHDVRPLYERHHLLVMRSYIMPKYGLSKPIPLSLDFDELDAETALEKATREKLEAERDVQLVTAGSIDGLDSRHRLQNEKGGSYANIEDAEPAEAPTAQNGVPQNDQTAPASVPASVPPDASPGQPSPGSR